LHAKEEYQNALEAMHNDLKDAETEIEQLKDSAERMQRNGNDIYLSSYIS
jgi:predicted ribosome quality control (RQC) complex YloA/Tae2 family protein